MQRRAFIASVSAATVSLGGCIGAGRVVDEPASDTTPGTVTTGVPADQLVEIRRDAFVPQVAEVEVGATVRWANHDERDHQVRSAQFHDDAATWEFSSGTLENGETITHTFEKPGVYEFYCSVRGKETTCGAVVVGDVDLVGSLPCEG